MEPFPSKELSGYLTGDEARILFEMNRTAQLGKLIRQHNLHAFRHVGLRYDGRAFTPGDIRDKVMEVI